MTEWPEWQTGAGVDNAGVLQSNAEELLCNAGVLQNNAEELHSNANRDQPRDERGRWTTAAEAAESVGLDRNAPWQVVHDALLDAGRGKEVPEYMRAAGEDASGRALRATKEAWLALAGGLYAQSTKMKDPAVEAVKLANAGHHASAAGKHEQAARLHEKDADIHRDHKEFDYDRQVAMHEKAARLHREAAELHRAARKPAHNSNPYHDGKGKFTDQAGDLRLAGSQSLRNPAWRAEEHGNVDYDAQDRATRGVSRPLPGQARPPVGNHELGRLANLAGKALYGEYDPRHADDPEKMGYYTEKVRDVRYRSLDQLQHHDALTAEYEHVFYPSRPGKGLDPALGWQQATHHWADKDGNIYSKDLDTIYVTHVDAHLPTSPPPRANALPRFAERPDVVHEVQGHTFYHNQPVEVTGGPHGGKSGRVTAAFGKGTPRGFGVEFSNGSGSLIAPHHLKSRGRGTANANVLLRNAAANQPRDERGRWTLGESHAAEGEAARQATRKAAEATVKSGVKVRGLRITSRGSGAHTAHALEAARRTETNSTVAGHTGLSHDTPVGIIHDVASETGNRAALANLHVGQMYYHERAAHHHTSAKLLHLASMVRAGDGVRGDRHENAADAHRQAAELHEREAAYHRDSSRLYGGHDDDR